MSGTDTDVTNDRIAHLIQEARDAGMSDDVIAAELKDGADALLEGLPKAMRITPEMIKLARPMNRHNAAGAKLTPTQLRMLQRIPDDGLPLSALRQRQGYGIGAQVRTLRILGQLGLVAEQCDGGDVRFEITDAGRRLIEPGAR